MYSVKEVFYSLQGEGHYSGRPAIFCRFTGCNLWNGKEEDRTDAICNFCDTDFIGTDGQNGGKFPTALELAKHLDQFWPQNAHHKFVVFTGGEPLLQLDEELIIKMHQLGYEIAVETNGTKAIPSGIDWLCVSPKGKGKIIVMECDELKLVYPQPDVMPSTIRTKAKYYYLSPKNNPNANHIYPNKDDHTKDTIEYCMAHPKWSLTLQSHKILNID
jgi:7-carboxy-7-deazaguanine synthase